MAAASTQHHEFPDLRGRHPREILEWAWATYGDRLMTTTAFGYSGMALFHMMAQVAPRVPIYFIDTGYHFAETLQFRDYCRDKLGLNIIDLRPEKTREQFEAEHGGPIYKTDPDRCCAINKVAPLQKMLRESNYAA
nr:phosphoadenosine phosphosulfate reductase family protein [Candidatus Sumerlaeota bacterium]